MGMRADVVVRVGVAGLAVVNGWWGVWARFGPRDFFDTFPGFGHHWTAAYPPYNEHLVTDLGSTFLTLAFLLGVGAAVSSLVVRRVVLGGVIVFNGLHLHFHAGHPGELTGVDLPASLTTLVLGLVGPLALLALEATAVRRAQAAARADREALDAPRQRESA